MWLHEKRCIDEANGEVLGFLDPDDKLSEIAIERMVASHILKKESISILKSFCLWRKSKGFNNIKLSKTDTENFLFRITMW